MADPVTLPAGASIALGTAATLTCAQAVACISGVPLELLIWGAVGGLIALIYAEPRQPPLVGLALARHAGGRLFSASALGGLSGGALLPVLARNISMFAGLDEIPLAPSLLAVVIGMGTAFLPEIFQYGRAWLQRGPRQ